jgi:hypothetical protein
VLKIGLKKYPKKDYPCLVVNGSTDSESFVFPGENGFHYAHIHDQKIADQLTAMRVRELEPHFRSFTIPYETDWNSFLDDVEVYFFDWHGKKDRKLQKDRKIKFELQPYGEEWAKPYSIAEYAEALEQTVRKLELPSVSYYEADELILNGFGIRCRMSSGNPVVKSEIDRCAEILKGVCREAEKLLAVTARKNSVTTFFSFPPAVKTACEQYLLYFVQFLEDLGIKANAEIKEDARRVLFSVTPADEKVALEQVRQALEIYLKLPGMPDFAAPAGQYRDLAVQQLQGNILHLQSQLTLARASMQVHEATIETLQLSNYQYRQLLSSGQKPKDKSNEEPLIGDTVHVTKFEGKGVKIDLPLILKRLKRVFGVGTKRIE